MHPASGVSATVNQTRVPLLPAQAVCKAFVDLMGGTIAIDPAYTNGTRTVITVALPEAAADDLAAIQRAKSLGQQSDLPPRLSWLLVDDSPEVRLGHRRLLGKAGEDWAFTEVQTGEEALARVDFGTKFDVIVMDQYMAKAGGACRRQNTV